MLVSDTHICGLLDASLAQVPPDASEEEKNASSANVQAAFERMIGNVKTATKDSRPLQLKTRDMVEERDIDFHPIVSGIFNALQATVQDIIYITKAALDFFNNCK